MSFSSSLVQVNVGGIPFSILKKLKVNPVNPENAAACKLVLPNGLDYDNLLDYTPYDENAGNEPQEEESVYIVAGLQVRKRV